MKNALLVGINYKGTNYQLNGCINDVTNMSKFLKTVLKYDKITEMTDDTPIKPTRANIISNLINMVKNSKRGDRLLFLYSGHGSLAKDQNGDEISGYDSCLCPIDTLKNGNYIKDDEIRNNIVNKIPAGVHMTFIFDCCNSGTGCDLTHTLNDNSDAKSDANSVEYNNNIMNTPEKEMSLVKKICKIKMTNIQSTSKNSKYKESVGNVCMLSGCLDSQTAADAYENGKYGGALCISLLEILKEMGPMITNGELLMRLRALIKEKQYSQKVQLMGGRQNQVDPNKMFMF
uniref:Peptidase C14 caspase domain-containing protein n=1 Tax=viral metagenome TaxID=1070528 RepID=A0A6C0I1S1_9ZZZZ